MESKCRPTLNEGTLFTGFSANVFEQAKVRDLIERYIADSLVHSLDVLYVKLQSRFTGGSVLAEGFCQ